MPNKIKLPKNVIRVPICVQSANYTCGEACLKSILQYYDIFYWEDQLVKDLGTDVKLGADYKQIAEFAKKLGFKVKCNQGMTLKQLKAELKKGNPVIVDMQAWSDTPDDYENNWLDSHYAVAIGYDNERIFFMDPLVLNYTYLPNDEFLIRWHDTDTYRNNIPINNLGIVISKKGKRKFNPDDVIKLD